MNVEFIFKKAADCLQLFKIYDEITPILSIQVFQDYVLIECMDESHTMISKCKVLESYFAYFKMNHQSILHIPMNVVDKILKCIDKDDMVKMEANQEHLVITLCKDKKKTKMKISLIDHDVESLQIPTDIEFDSVAKLDSYFFSQQIHKLKQLGEHTIRFKTDPTFLNIKSTGDLVETDISIEADKLDLSDKEIKLNQLVFLKTGMYSHEFSLSSIKQFMTPTSWISHIQIYMKKDFPILFNYETDDVSLKYYLAPKIEDE